MKYSIQNLGSDILWIEDLLEAELCNHLIEVAEFCHFESKRVTIGSVDTSVGKESILSLDRRNPIQKAANDLILKKIQVIQEALLKLYSVNFTQVEPCSIVRYSPSQNDKRRIDNLLLGSRLTEVEQGLPTRDVSIVGYLNDDFDGGELFFDRQSIKVPPKKGGVLVFPAYYTHPHQSLLVTRGRKYIWQSWLYY